MNLRSGPFIIIIGFALAPVACIPPVREYEPDDEDLGHTETNGTETTSPVLPPPPEVIEPDEQGWCCDCDNKIGNALICTPAAADSCIGTTLAWCELDEDGRPSACEAECDTLGWCCDCSEQPHIECWQTPANSCSYQWCRQGPLACADECPRAVCCDCEAMSCWHSDGLDCDEPHEHWCIAGVDCFAECE